jgi:hypothetical protein
MNVDILATRVLAPIMWDWERYADKPYTHFKKQIVTAIEKVSIEGAEPVWRMVAMAQTLPDFLAQIVRSRGEACCYGLIKRGGGKLSVGTYMNQFEKGFHMKEFIDITQFASAFEGVTFKREDLPTLGKGSRTGKSLLKDIDTLACFSTSPDGRCYIGQPETSLQGVAIYEVLTLLLQNPAMGLKERPDIANRLGVMETSSIPF